MNTDQCGYMKSRWSVVFSQAPTRLSSMIRRMIEERLARQRAVNRLNQFAFLSRRRSTISSQGAPPSTGFAAAIAAAPTSSPQCKHRLPGQVIHHHRTNRLPHLGQRKPSRLKESPNGLVFRQGTMARMKSLCTWLTTSSFAGTSPCSIKISAAPAHFGGVKSAVCQNDSREGWSDNDCFPQLHFMQ